MKRFAFALFVSLFALLSVAASQSSTEGSKMPYAGAPCTGDGGIKPSNVQIATFKRFDEELRSALKRNDAAAIAFLVTFPLRVNTSKGTLLIPDAQSLSGHYVDIFPPEVRDKILASGTDDYICRYDQGVGYKDGVIWASADGHKFAVFSVNTPDLHAKSEKPQLVYTCETQTHRITIEDLNDSKYHFRYRSWNKPKELSNPPDVEISNGAEHFEGTGICAVPVYTFKKGDAEYTVSGGFGCTDGKEPQKATGDLHVTVAGKDVTQVWCF